MPFGAVSVVQEDRPLRRPPRTIQLSPTLSETWLSLKHLIGLLVLLGSCATAPCALQIGWTSQDLGAVGQPGSASYTNDAWVISGSGTDICGSDQLHLVWRMFTGDGVFTAMVASLTNSALAQAGIMLRNDASGGALEVSILATSSSGVTFQWRGTPGAGCNYQVAIGAQNLGVPIWIRLVRTGNAFSGFFSTNNLDWVQVGGTQTVALNDTVLGGLAVSANDNTMVSTAVFTDVSAPSPVFGIYRELWTGLRSAPGNTLDALTNAVLNPGWPTNPDTNFTAVLASLETETNTGMSYYGQRLRTFVVPPTNGYYTLWISSHNTSKLSLSSDEISYHSSPVAWVNTATAPRQWDLETNQHSAPIFLQAGHRYYLEALMQDTTGEDSLSVRWTLPNGAIEEPLTAITPAGTRLIPCSMADAFPGIYLQPTNATAADGGSVAFSVLVTNQGPISYQWLVNGTPISGSLATAPVFVISNANPGLNNGQVFTCVVSNSVGTLTSDPGLLTVVADTIPPTVVLGEFLDPSHIQILFSKPLSPASATNLANYAFTNAHPIVGAALLPDNVTVTLQTSPLVAGSNYFLVLNGIQDRASTPNTIVPNTQVRIFAGPFTPLDIGNPTPAGSLVGNGGGYDILGGGRDLGGTSDQFQFAYQTLVGDFDMKVRLNSLTQTDPYAKAGLIARADLTPNCQFAATFTTPSISGSVFEWRAAAGGNTASAGDLPVNFPETWLRLQRTGNLFTGYAGYDGTTWEQLGSTTLVLTNPIYFGMAVSSRNSSQAALAQFRELSPATNSTIGTVLLPHEPLGPCSRLTPIVISEIMYKPALRADTNILEFIEIYNSNPYFEDISGFQIAGGSISYTFPAGTILAGGAFLVIAASPSSIANVYGISNVTGPYTGSLKKSGTIQLLDEQGSILLTVPYSSTYPWPVAAQGTGHSIVLANPTYGEGDPHAWQVSDVIGGSPGGPDGFRPAPLRNVVINEFLAHSENPSVPQFLELYNHSSQSVDVSGCILTDDPATNKFVCPTGTVIGPGRFLSLAQAQLGFALNGGGGTVLFISPDGSQVLDAVEFEAQADGVSFGRWPDGADAFYPLAARTSATNNSPPQIGDIVINELMYDPITGNDADQYVELYNKGSRTVSLAGWRFTAGISFTFPPGTSLAPDSYLVVAADTTNLFSKYPNLNPGNTLGNFAGKLSHKGERLALSQPEPLTVPSALGPVTNTVYVTEDEVTFAAGGRWGQWAHGGGSSLELISPNTNHRLAHNWADSDETAKSSWTNLEFTGTLDNGATYNGTAVNQVHVGLLDIGECLVDNIEVLPGGPNGANIVANGDFEAGSGSWLPQGDHMRSSLETALGGYQSARSFHLRSSDAVWTLGDYLQGTLNQTTLGAGQTATLRLKARWLRGWPEILMRLRGNFLEVTGAMPLPPNLGTPGMRNSRYVATPGPAIYEVKHSPPLPAANQPVLVTARFHDTVGFQPTLLYRVDRGVNANPTYVSVPMLDDGTGGDMIAGDGLYTATIPPQPARTVVAFLVQAQDVSGAASIFPEDLKNNAGIPRECVLAFGDPIPTGNFSHHHVFLTQNWAQRWSQGGGVSHELYDGTWVDGGGRIVYDWQGRYAGSPYHQYLGSPVNTIGGMHWIMPDDDQVLGTTSLNKQHLPGNGPLDDDTLQREQTCYWMAHQVGIGRQNRRYYVFYVNGVRHGPLMEDAQVPGAEMIKEYWPKDSNGWLYKNHSWFEGDVLPQSNAYFDFSNMSWCYLGQYTTTINGIPEYKLARYRWMWSIRQFPDSANSMAQVYALIDAANIPTSNPNYYLNLESLVDTEEWLRLSAMEHASGDWDSFFTQNQWNMYCYKPTMGKWTALKWDWNISLGGGTTTWPSDGSQLFNFNSNDPVFARFQNYPPYLRAYLRALQDIANLAMNNTRVNPLLDAKYAAFVANGLSTNSYNGLVVRDPGASGGLKTWIGTMHNSILTALTNRGVSNVPFAITSTTINNNVATITGTAPLAVKTIWFNGMEWPVLWSTVSGWSVNVPLEIGTNQFAISGVDLRSQAVPGATNNLALVYTGPPVSPVGSVVLNEVMYNPAVPGADYIELFNNSTTTAFDLSGWELRGLAYFFPPGTLLEPRGFLVLAANRSAYSAAYGGTAPLFDTYPAPISANGQTILLVNPGGGIGGTNELIVAGVRYGNTDPWMPVSTGSSLQLIDSEQDNWRIANWTSNSTTNSGPPAPQWQYVTLTGTAPRPILLICMHGTAGDVYVDDLKLVQGSVPEAGPNLLQNGDFESTLTGPWTVSPNLSNSIISTSVKHSGNASLHVIATSPGDSIPLSIWENTGPIITNGTYTLSYWYLPSTNGSQLLLRLSGSSPNAGQVYSLQDIQPPLVSTAATSSPGTANSVIAALPPFPPLWINEVQALNLTGITNSAGAHSPWVELYNPTTNVVPLTGLFLANVYSNLEAWPFPAGAVVNPGEFKVIFCDGQTSLSASNELHTSFALEPITGSLALSWNYNGQPQVLDYLDYTNLVPNHSYGSLPDGQSFFRQEFSYPSPAAANNGSNAPPQSSFIAYTKAGSTYLQNFNTLPAPSGASVNAANPVSINGTTYSLDNPFDFAAPASASGNTGGLGLPDLAGWYGHGSLASKFGAADGDQTTGGQISFGSPGSGDRALGLLATSSTGGTAFGARFINETPATLNLINLRFTGEVWRQSNIPKTLTCSYLVDLSGSAGFPTTSMIPLPGLTVALPSDPAVVGGIAVDGSAAANQVALSLLNQPIVSWPPGTALWLVWDMADAAGKAQGLAIDDLSFAASDQPMLASVPLTIASTTETNIVISWPALAGQTYQTEFADDLTNGGWAPLGSPVIGTGSTIVLTNDASLSTHRFFRLRILP